MRPLRALFRGVTINEGEFKIKLSVSRKLVGLLRWYSAVIPMASTFAMQGLLTKMERLALTKLRTHDPMCNIRGAAKAEIVLWAEGYLIHKFGRRRFGF